MNEDELLDAVAGDLFTYVLDGNIPPDDLAELVKPNDFPEQYADFERLVDLHFILKDDVLQFAEELKERLRSVKTEIETSTEIQRGGLDGRIDWHDTHRQRATSSPGNRGFFVTETRTEEYATPENLVLKELVTTIKRALRNVDRYLDENRSWVTETWVTEQRLRERFTTVVDRNVHLQRIPDPGPNEPTGRMVSRSAASRKQLYRDAAELLRARHNYRDGPESLVSLLKDTTITPEGRETLFELFVLFRLLRAMRSVESTRIGKPTYHTIASDRRAVATFDGTGNLRAYYNRTPDDPEVSFDSSPESTPPRSRSDQARRVAKVVANEFFTDSEIRNHTKRPDILIVAENRKEPTSDYLVVEVKDSTNRDTIRRGINQIVEYLAFLRRDENHVLQRGDFGRGLNGVLVVQDLDDVDIQPVSLAKQASSELPVRIVQARHLDDVLTSLVYRIFCH